MKKLMMILGMIFLLTAAVNAQECGSTIWLDHMESTTFADAQIKVHGTNNYATGCLLEIDGVSNWIDLDTKVNFETYSVEILDAIQSLQPGDEYEIYDECTFIVNDDQEFNATSEDRFVNYNGVDIKYVGTSSLFHKCAFEIDGVIRWIDIDKVIYFGDIYIKPTYAYGYKYVYSSTYEGDKCELFLRDCECDIDITCSSCTDTDGGKNYDVKGEVPDWNGFGGPGPEEDYCSGDNHQVLTEWFCENGEPSWETHTCAVSCHEGACVDTIIAYCEETDGGKDYYNKGTAESDLLPLKTDSCLTSNPGIITEYYCENRRLKFETVACPNGELCVSGACVAPQETICPTILPNTPSACSVGWKALFEDVYSSYDPASDNIVTTSNNIVSATTSQSGMGEFYMYQHQRVDGAVRIESKMRVTKKTTTGSQVTASFFVWDGIVTPCNEKKEVGSCNVGFADALAEVKITCDSSGWCDWEDIGVDVLPTQDHITIAFRVRDAWAPFKTFLEFEEPDVESLRLCNSQVTGQVLECNFDWNLYIEENTIDGYSAKTDNNIFKMSKSVYMQSSVSGIHTLWVFQHVPTNGNMGTIKTSARSTKKSTVGSPVNNHLRIWEGKVIPCDVKSPTGTCELNDPIVDKVISCDSSEWCEWVEIEENFATDEDYVTVAYRVRDAWVGFPVFFEVEDYSINWEDVEDPQINSITKGSAAAPITMEMFVNYDETFTKRFFDETYEQIVDNYVDTNNVKLVYRHFDLSFYEYGRLASNAVYCAHEQGKGVEYIELIMKASEISPELLDDAAIAVGVTNPQFSDCLTNNKYDWKLDEDTEYAHTKGINGAPGFLVNNKKIAGAQPYSVFVDAFEGNLVHGQVCTDYDGGKNFATKSYAIMESSNNVKREDDSCMNNRILLEKYCDENENIQTYQYTCPHGCKNGICEPASTANMQDEPMLGDKNAPVEMIMYGEFEDPFSYRWYENSFRAIKEDYIDTSKVSFVYSNFPLSFHPHANYAALGGECAHEQGAFWKYYKEVYEHNREQLTDAYIESIGEFIDIDQDKYFACLQLADFQSEVDADVEEGQALGVSGVPTFFINGEKIVGAQPLAQFVEAIEAALETNCEDSDDGNKFDQAGFVKITSIGGATEISRDYCIGESNQLVEYSCSGNTIVDTRYSCPDVCSDGACIEIKSCDGCMSDDRCLPYGSRVIRDEESLYCSFDGEFKNQKDKEAICQNNYECLSNSCLSGSCTDIREELQETRNFIQRLLNWFERLFG